MSTSSCFYGGMVPACQALSILLGSQFGPMQRDTGGLCSAAFLDRPEAGLLEHLARLGNFPHFLPSPSTPTTRRPCPNIPSLGPFLSGQGNTYSFCNVSFSSYATFFSP